MEISIKDKVFMENENIKIFNQIEKKAKAYFKKYLGEKIFLNEGSLIKKIKEDPEFKEIINEKNYKVEPLKPGDHVQLWFIVHSGSGYTLSIIVKLCYNGGSYEDRSYYCVYVEHYVYIGNTENTILKTLYDPEQKPLIDAEEQTQRINLFKEKSKELKVIRDSINYNLKDFIKYDLVN